MIWHRCPRHDSGSGAQCALSDIPADHQHGHAVIPEDESAAVVTWACDDLDIQRWSRDLHDPT